MSGGAFKRVLTRNIIKILEKSGELKTAPEIRIEQQPIPTVLEISPDILFKNIEGLKSRSVASKFSRRFVKAFREVYPNMKPFNPEVDEYSKGTKISYMQTSPNEIVLVAPSYKSIRALLSKVSSHPTISDNKFLGSVYETRTIQRSSGDFEPITQWWSRLDLGHQADTSLDREKSAIGRDTIATLRAKELFKAIPTTSPNTKLMVRYLKRVNKLHLPYTSKFTKTIKKTGESFANFHFVYVVPQSHTLNRQLGAAEGLIMRKLGDELVSTKTSPPFIVSIVNKVLSLFQDEPYDAGTSNSNSAGKVTIKKKKPKANITSIGADRLRDEKGRFTSPINLMALLNARLHDQIRLNMGKGNSRQILNYRTGRFASSAKVTSIAQKGNSVIANYTFMRSPYDVFMPGGRLYKSGRNPERIINKSIRQLATELVSKKLKLQPNLTEGL